VAYSSLLNIGRGPFFFFFVSFREIPDCELNSQPFSFKVGSFDSDGKPGGHLVARFSGRRVEDRSIEADMDWEEVSVKVHGVGGGRAQGTGDVLGS
jgi:hypothetical protein